MAPAISFNSIFMARSSSDGAVCSDAMAGFDRSTQKVLISWENMLQRTGTRQMKEYGNRAQAGKIYTYSRLIVLDGDGQAPRLWMRKNPCPACHEICFFANGNGFESRWSFAPGTNILQTYAGVLDGDKRMPPCFVFPGTALRKRIPNACSNTYLRHAIMLAADRWSAVIVICVGRPEGAFGICGFWAVEYLALGGGTLQQAHIN